MYGSIFEAAKGAVTRTLACAVIGAAVTFFAVLKADRPPPGPLWSWVAVGAGIGFIAALGLTLIDRLRGRSAARARARDELVAAFLRDGIADEAEAIEHAEAVLTAKSERRLIKLGFLFVAAIFLLILILALTLPRPR